MMCNASFFMVNKLCTKALKFEVDRILLYHPQYKTVAKYALYLMYFMLYAIVIPNLYILLVIISLEMFTLYKNE